MSRHKISTTVTNTVVLGAGGYGNTLTITGTGDISPAAYGADGITAPAGLSGVRIVNRGEVHGGEGAPGESGGIAVDMQASGTITNVGLIAGGAGVNRQQYGSIGGNGGVGVVLDALHQSRTRGDPDGVPADVRHFRARREAFAPAREDAATGDFWSLAAAFEKPLQANTDAKERDTRRKALPNSRSNALLCKHRGRREMPYAGQDDPFRIPDHCRIGGDESITGAERVKGFQHRREIAGLVVDDSNHQSRPLVLGSISPSC